MLVIVEAPAVDRAKETNVTKAILVLVRTLLLRVASTVSALLGCKVRRYSRRNTVGAPTACRGPNSQGNIGILHSGLTAQDTRGSKTHGL